MLFKAKAVALSRLPGLEVKYMVGAIEKSRLRGEASRRLGSLDIRRFHDRILEDGALSMNALRRKIEGWAAEVHPRSVASPAALDLMR